MYRYDNDTNTENSFTGMTMIPAQRTALQVCTGMTIISAQRTALQVCTGMTIIPAQKKLYRYDYNTSTENSFTGMTMVTK
jgi:hypothetical protein